MSNTVIIALLVVLLLGAGFVLFRTLSKNKASSEEKTEPTQSHTEPQTHAQTQTQPKQPTQPTPPVKEEPTTPSVKSYPAFSHKRLLEMGLEEAEAQEFVQDLIQQIRTQLPEIQKALKASDFTAMERLTHSIKGSATNIGVGGVSDLLVEYNTYLKSGDDIALAQRYLITLQKELQNLEAQYRA
jgi:HPt (histidine-containing phosphotransfer) domain-containing protein